MEIIPLGPGFAAELRGVTLADVAADDAVYAAVRAAFEDHSVLLFRGQEVSGEGQLAFSRRFGPPETTKVGSLGTGTNFVILTTIGDDGKVVPEDHRYAMRNKANQLWHTDSSFKAVPALTSVLSARTIPDHGGETEFASTRLAFERLDPALQKKFENSFAWHHYGHSRAKVAAGLATPEELDALPPQCWRLVWRNPVNGRGALYIASHTYAIEGMERAAGEQLIEELTAAATAPGTTYEHKWKSGDVIMWDNRATMHRGRPWPGNEPRYMVRTTISATAADGVETMRPPSAAGGGIAASFTCTHIWWEVSASTRSMRFIALSANCSAPICAAFPTARSAAENCGSAGNIRCCAPACFCGRIRPAPSGRPIASRC